MLNTVSRLLALRFASHSETLHVDTSNESELSRLILFRGLVSAHFYSGLAAFLFVIIGTGSTGQSMGGSNSSDQFAVTPIVMLQVAFGSLSFAVFEIFGGAFATFFGNRRSILVGMLSTAAFGCISGTLLLVRESLPAEVLFISTWFLSGFIGFSLSLISGADTVLIRRRGTELGLGKEKLETLERMCTASRQILISLFTIIGIIVFCLLRLFGYSPQFAMSIVMFCTAASQLLSIKIIPKEEASNDVQQTESAGIRRLISDPRFLQWALLFCSIEGLLIFSKYFFEYDAFDYLLQQMDKDPSLLATVALVLLSLSFVSAAGARVSEFIGFSRKRKAADGLPANENERRRVLVITTTCLAFLSCYVVFFLLNEIGFGGIYTSLVLICAFQFLRAFVSPVLTTGLLEVIDRGNREYATLVFSIANAGGRAMHFFTAAIFVACTALIVWTNKANVDVMSSHAVVSGATGKDAIAATIAISLIFLIVLNFVCLLSLDRTSIKPSPPSLRSVFKLLGEPETRGLTIKAFFICSLVLSSTLAIKEMHFGTILLNAGALPYSLTFLLSDVINECEGPKSGRRLWICGLIAYLFVILVMVLAFALPEAKGEDSSSIVARFVVGMIGGICSYTLAQYTDITIYHRLKLLFDGGCLWIRNAISTILSQTLDSFIFVSIYYSFVLWNDPEIVQKMSSYLIGMLIIKWSLAILGTPLLYLGVWWVRPSIDQNCNENVVQVD